MHPSDEPGRRLRLINPSTNNYAINIFVDISAGGGLFFTGCRPEGFEQIGPANDNLTAISGAWKLTKVTQTDFESQRKGFPYAVRRYHHAVQLYFLQLTLTLNAGAPAIYHQQWTAPPITSITFW